MAEGIFNQSLTVVESDSNRKTMEKAKKYVEIVLRKSTANMQVFLICENSLIKKRITTIIYSERTLISCIIKE